MTACAGHLYFLLGTTADFKAPLVHHIKIHSVYLMGKCRMSHDEREPDPMPMCAQEEEAQEDAREILQGKPYHWRDWSIIRGRDCLYIWSDAAALELSNGSNGWFRFILDGKLATMYSSGSPEGGSDSSGNAAPTKRKAEMDPALSDLAFPFPESRSEFLEKLQRARSQVKPVTSSQPVLSGLGPTKLTVGNWSLTCLKDGEIAIHNSDGQQATILKEDLPGFVFESNRGTKHSFTAETSLGEKNFSMLARAIGFGH